MQRQLCYLIPLSLFTAQLHSYHPEMNKLSKTIFTTIYKTNAWLDPDTASGPGSNLQQTATIRAEIPLLIEKYNIESVLDAACGDCFWIRNTNLPSCLRYIGIDIVDDIIEENRKRNFNPNWSFDSKDITTDDLPSVDMILCRDCVAHHDFSTVKRVINNFKRSGSKYLLITTYPNVQQNEDLPVQQLFHLWRYRPINFQKAPFNFPEPITCIDEKNSDSPNYKDKKLLALWRLDTLPTL